MEEKKHLMRMIDTIPLDEPKTLKCGHQVELLSNAYGCFNDDSYDQPCTEHEGLQMQQIELSAVDFYQQPLSQSEPYVSSFQAVLLTELLLIPCINGVCDGQCNFCKAHERIVKEWQADVDTFLSNRSITCPECHALKVAA